MSLVSIFGSIQIIYRLEKRDFVFQKNSEEIMKHKYRKTKFSESQEKEWWISNKITEEGSPGLNILYDVVSFHHKWSCLCIFVISHNVSEPRVWWVGCLIYQTFNQTLYGALLPYIQGVSLFMPNILRYIVNRPKHVKILQNSN